MSYRRVRRETRMSKEEAEDIIENEARSKDFWCADYKDQSEKLQQVVDVKFNCIRGNHYIVDYQENQNGTRLVVRCQICSKDLSSLDPFLSHDSGKAHNKVRQQVLSPKDPNLQGELRLRPLKTYKGIFPKDSLEDLIDSTSSTILGIQFVYKEVINGKERFTCQLCKKSSNVEAIRKSKMFSHLKSRAHNSKYLQVKFHEFKFSYSNFEDFALNIEEREGKIHGPVVDFTMQYVVNTKPKLVSSNYEPLGKKCMKQIKDSPAGRSRHGSDNRSPKEKFKRHRNRSCSRSCSPVIVASRSCSWEGGPASPTLFDIRNSTPHPQLPPPMPKKPAMVDVGISVDMSDQARNIVSSLNLLPRREALDKIAEDEEMQQLLHLTLWYLNQKLEKYFTINQSTLYIKNDQKVVPATVATEKLKCHIKDLKPIRPA